MRLFKKMLRCRAHPCRPCLPVYLLRVDLDVLRLLGALGNNPWINRYSQLRWFIMLFEWLNIVNFVDIMSYTLLQYPYWYLSCLYIPLRFFSLPPHKWFRRIPMSYLTVLTAASYVLSYVFLVIPLVVLPYFFIIPLVLVTILYAFGTHYCLAHYCPSCYYGLYYTSYEDARRNREKWSRRCCCCCPPEACCAPERSMSIERV